MISFQSELICNIIRSSDEYSSLHDMEVKHTLAASYDVSPKITIGITKNSGKTSSEEDDEIAIAGQYEINSDHLVKAKLNNNGIFGLFHRGKLANNIWTEASFKTGLNPDQKINGSLGSNLQLGLKMLFKN